MTESELKAIKWMENIKNDAIVVLQKEPHINPLIYNKRKEAAETIIKGFEELERYRLSGGTSHECSKAIGKQKEEIAKTIKMFDITYMKCPRCKMTIGLYNEEMNPNYCSNCGQKIALEKTE